MATEDVKATTEATKVATDATKEYTSASIEAAEATKHFEISSGFVKNALNFVSKAGYDAKEAIKSLDRTYYDMKTSIQSMNALTQEQANQFNLLSMAVFGASNEFKSLNDLDFSGFENQLNRLNEVTRGGLIGSITKMMEIGGKGKFKTDGIADVVEGQKKIVESLVVGADTATRFSQSILATASASGTLSSVYEASGEHLEKFNEYSRQQYTALQTTAGSLGLTANELVSYRNALAKLPGVLDDNVESTVSSTGQTKVLAEAIIFATGSGRTYKEVIGDITRTYSDFNMRGQDSIQFIGRIQELTDKFGSKGVVYSDVADSLFKMSTEYKNVTDSGSAAARMTEGMSRIMNDYLGRLTEVGVTGKHATEMISGLTDGISHMNVAQKSFLSSQTGGPGGLQGAFQIQKMLRDGNIEGVMEKVQQQLKSQLGDIVTLDQASQSQEAAKKFQRQVMILRQGPMGSFVKSDEDAMKFLEAMKKREEGGKENPLAERSYEKYEAAGKELTDRRKNAISLGVSQIEAQRMEASFASKDQLENLFGAGKGSSPNPESDIRRESKAELRKLSDDMMDKSSKTYDAMKDDLAKGKIEDRKGQSVYDRYDFGSRAFDTMVKDSKNQIKLTAENVLGLKGQGSKEEQQEAVKKSLTEAAAKDKKEAMASEALRQTHARDKSTQTTSASVETAPKEVIHSVRIHVDAVCPDCAHKHTSTTVHGLNPPASRRGL